jgi:endonuclease YncB( thermonuclease family)
VLLARLLVATIAVTASLALAASPAAGSTGPCVPGGPSCTFWTGKVVFVADGDTIDVDVAGDGTRTPRRVRLTGFNAMELRRYSSIASRRRGDCHAVQATGRLDHLLRRGHRRVRLAAQDPASHANVRLRRQVSVRLHDAWVDVGRLLVSEGHALWLPNQTEWAWNREYAGLSEQAAAAQLRLWDPQGCGIGPSPDAGLTLRINPDAAGDDRFNLNDEWAKITNPSSAAVRLQHWWFRDSGLRRYTFPASAVVPPGGTVTLRMGSGTNTDDTFYWGLRTPPFDNVRDDGHGMGDGGYLFDPRGNLRVSVIYR